MRTRRGFTLAEIILVIVIGFFLLYVALVTYAQAKTAAGISKARDKVYALQQLVEQMATTQGGTYPHLDQVASAWRDKRPSDVDRSPFGGRITTGFNNGRMTAAVTQGGPTVYYGIDGEAGCFSRPCYGGEIPAYPNDKDDIAPVAYPSPHPMYSPLPGTDGLIEYRRIYSNTTAGATASFFELTTNKMTEVRSYAISIRNPVFQPILFVGGAPQP
ncbi:MAG: type II secretion system protein [Candidatus Sericytochromatia bacterium]|nr:type II secretion system protein [Candidatus Tanganyikabacteria bacterium]